MRALESVIKDGIKNFLQELRLMVRRLTEFLHIIISMVIIGCLHSRMGRPFTVNGVTYRTCTDCGAHRLFDLDTWQMYGPYFYQFPQIKVNTPASKSPHPSLAGHFLGQELRQAA